MVPLPVIAHSPETELLLGAAAVIVFRPKVEAHRATSLKTVAAYSTNATALLEAGLDAFLLNDRAYLGVQIGLQHMPSTFYGIGNATELDAGEDFTRRTLALELQPMYAAIEYFYAGPLIRLDLYELDQREDGGLLDRAAVLGAHSGRDVGIGAGARYDSRDNSVNPVAGFMLKASVRAHHGFTGSEFAYERYRVDARTYLSTVREQVLALALDVAGVRGQVPYFNLLELGGFTLLRGHAQGRYRDKVRVVAQAEYRVPIVWRIGVVAFVGAGDVGSAVGDLLSHSLKYAVGGGLRLMLDTDARVNLALDVGYAGDQSGLYIELGEAF